MLAENVLDRVSSLNDLRVIMDEKLNFSEHIDVMVVAMLGFIKKLSFEFRDSHTLRSLYTVFMFIRSWSTPAVYGAHSMSCVWTRLLVCTESLNDMLCVVWVGRIFAHRMSSCFK
jgi:hypothetical protein